MTTDIARRLEVLADEVQQSRSAAVLRTRLSDGCWVYGAGGYGQQVVRSLLNAGYPVRGVIDRRASDPGFEIDPKIAMSAPDAMTAAAISGTTLVVGVHNFAADPAPILAWATAAGFADIIVPAELPDVVDPTLGSYWLIGRRHLLDHLAKVESVNALLEDDASRAVLDRIARFRVSADYAVHPPSHLASQYFPDDVPLTRDPLIMVDGGAFTGDALTAIRRSDRRLAEWYAFEPDLVNFAALVTAAGEAKVERTALFPCGLGQRSEQVRFASGEAAGSHAAESGESVIQLVALDEVLPGLCPNYVKLDIEGAERDALTGMRHMLERARPAIAMSIYHRPEDLWELPLLIHDALPDARLYIRQHGFNGFDTVLYAVP